MRSDVEWEADGRRPSRGERVCDGVALLLLMWPATGGMWLLGSTRAWGYAPGLALSFSGSLLVLLRGLFFRGVPRGRVPAAFWALAALTILAASSLGWAPVALAARWEALRWGCLLAAAWSWTQMGGIGHRWKWLMGILLLSVALGDLYALIQQVTNSNQVLWMARPEQYGMRASGPYLCPNHFANMVAMLAPVALALVLLPEAGFPLRLMGIYFLAISAPALYWTQSRSGWLGLAGGLGTTVLLLAWRRSRIWFGVALVALPLLAAGAGLGAWKALPKVRERVGAVLEDPEKAGGDRLAMWRDAPAMFRDRPILGFGAGSYVWAYLPYQRHVRAHLNYDYPHNDFLQLLLEYGGVGLGLALAGLLACAWGVVRGVARARSRVGAFLLAGAGGAGVASGLHALFDFNFHIFPNPHALVWIGGVAWGVWFAQEKGAAPAAGRGGWIRRAGAVAGAVACGGCAWVALAGGVSYAWNLKGEMARARMEWDEAEAAYAKAIRWDAWNWKPHLGLGNLQMTKARWLRDPDLQAEREGRRRLSLEASEHFQAALERNPRDMAGRFGLAMAANARGEPEEALEQLRRATAHQPRHRFYREQVGIQLRQMGRDAEALEVFRQNLAEGVGGEVTWLNVKALERKLAREAAAAAAPTP